MLRPLWSKVLNIVEAQRLALLYWFEFLEHEFVHVSFDNVAGCDNFSNSAVQFRALALSLDAKGLSLLLEHSCDLLSLGLKCADEIIYGSSEAASRILNRG